MLNFKRLRSYIYHKVYRTSVDVGNIEQQKNGTWKFTPNEIGIKLYPLGVLKCQTKQELEYRLYPKKYPKWRNRR